MHRLKDMAPGAIWPGPWASGAYTLAAESATFSEPDIPETPDVIASLSHINDTDKDDTYNFTNSANTNDSITWTTTSNVTTGIALNFNVALPTVGGASAGYQASFSTSRTETVTKAVQKTWSWQLSIPVAAHKGVTTNILLKQGALSAYYSVAIRLRGKFGGSYFYPHQPSQDVEVKAGVLFRGKEPDGVRVVDDDTIEILRSGRIDGIVGVGIVSRSHQFDIPPH